MAEVIEPEKFVWFGRDRRKQKVSKWGWRGGYLSKKEGRNGEGGKSKS